MRKHSAFNITGVLATLLAIQGAAAADLTYSPEPIAEQDLMLPAVSGPNGKWEFALGPSGPGPISGRGAGSFSLPIGERFGVQFDAAVSGSASGWLAGGAVHAFTRDPDGYLIGIASALVRGPTGTLGVVGAEAELYLDDLSLEAWAGVAGVDYDVLPDVGGLFVIADAAYYLTDDFRASVGLSHLLGVNGLHIGLEYQLSDWSVPVSLTADGRLNTDGSYSLMAGLKGYFGGEQKSLKDRHRQDDPPNRVLSLFTAGGGLLSKTADECTLSFDTGSYGTPYIADDCEPSDPEAYLEFCNLNGYNSVELGNGPNGECTGYIGNL